MGSNIRLSAKTWGQRPLLRWAGPWLAARRTPTPAGWSGSLMPSCSAGGATPA